MDWTSRKLWLHVGTVTVATVLRCLGLLGETEWTVLVGGLGANYSWSNVADKTKKK